MADNVTVANDDLTDYVVASDDDGTAQHQYVKVEYGADGTFTKVSGTAGLPVKPAPGAATGTQSSVAGSASNVTLLAQNLGRIGATINNDSTAILYVKLGATASTSSYTYKLQPDGVCEIPYGYTGIIDGIWASATGNARISEFT